MADFPFVYLNHGPLLLESIGKCDGAYVGFVADVPDALKAELIQSCPEPIKGFASFTGNLLAIESPGDVYDWSIVEDYGTPEEKKESESSGRAAVGRETADRFSAAVEQWVTAMHALHPIRFVMGPGSSEGSDWHEWSRNCFTATVVPFLEALSESHPELKAEPTYDDEEELEEGDDTDTLIDEDAATLMLQPLGHGHIACLLQEFDPYHEIPVSAELQPRVDALLETFQL